MHIDRSVLLFLTLALLVSGPRWVEARCPPPPPLLAAPENGYARTPAVRQAVLDNGGPRAITATRLENEESIDIDGRLDEAIWSRVIPVGDFIQIDPDNGQPSTERTDVRIAFDNDAPYMGEAQFSPFVTLVNNFQYDTQSAVLGWQSRFRWIVTPGNDLYVVYTHNWLEDPLLSRFTTLDKRVASKIFYTYRL